MKYKIHQFLVDLTVLIIIYIKFYFCISYMSWSKYITCSVYFGPTNLANLFFERCHYQAQKYLYRVNTHIMSYKTLHFFLILLCGIHLIRCNMPPLFENLFVKKSINPTDLRPTSFVGMTIYNVCVFNFKLIK